ncbi:hypothetical protein N7454_008682 [Penicillium verhagenii]|uniref:uncharacterized protein n=1 Tax=Penicillium verhagenii TaxID=1562060 RepID=UPI002545ACD5|nr:uncharacterized protein N7466_007671 [Penicillium verhagenii]KAJ5923437.1 hypothetical protein N7454_008682 [Penicillium verhagenii]KAJ5928715.1 hypothetical protein N7466_007671 [Penicillium verhagenii]
MGLTRAAVIVIVLAACLAITAMGAALFRRYNPLGDTGLSGDASHQQNQYMRAVRLRNYGHLKRESLGAVKDLESRYTTEELSGHYPQYASEPKTPSTNVA